MVQVLNSPIKDLFMQLVCESNTSIELCAPYVKTSIVSSLLQQKQNSSSLKLLTTFNLNNFYKGSSDIDAVKLVNEHNGSVFNSQRLHAKVYLFDKKYAIITSANLTYSGFEKNIEYGVLFDEPPLVKQVSSDFESICSDEATGKIDVEKIQHITRILNNLPEYKEPCAFMPPEVSEDKVLDVDKDRIISQLSGWQSITFRVIDAFGDMNFSLADVYEYENTFQKAYPNNNTIPFSIRRNLQELRDLGLIKFNGNGKYTRLWK
ncbi:phospholipase D-like domain-containing protein [Caproiciproducens galactitolivorans]|uniref:Phospholipase D-like domain-containing protein n=1 Tax=Caproiciproducens galactitolivorans TaxID=642589 RepID=A0ABT4BUB7_9FIRM|nr:phospholipase D-like domain-containing protein [Caproiciproducens galactitolivorans]MCY1714485.1 phospholipase D-like domain-containing protein [Caproiciproducens galactitolivorans]